MRVAVAHDWLTGMRGGEQCLEALLDMYPDSEIFTLLHVPGSVSPKIEARPIHASFIDRLPAVRTRYRYFLPLFPAAIQQFRIRGFDLVVSISHCVAKALRVPDGVPHLCYCLTPMRYLWDQYESYFGAGRASPLVRSGMALLAPPLRRWDVSTVDRVDRFVACSQHVQRRIARTYARDAVVVYPPVALERFSPGRERGDFYLTVSALVPYKRVDLIIAAFNRLGRRLIVVGGGSEHRRLWAMAGPNVTLTGRIDDDEVADLMARCRAFVFAAEEDFGIALVEAQASGAPVVAYGVGGASEIVRGVNHRDAPSRPTGVFFYEQRPEAIAEAVLALERTSFDPTDITSNARRFVAADFTDGLHREINRLTG